MQTSESAVLTRLESIVSDQLDQEDVVLTMNTVATNVDGWDSLAHVRIMIAVEEEFGVKFQMSEITSLSDVGELVRLIQAKLPA